MGDRHGILRSVEETEDRMSGTEEILLNISSSGEGDSKL
jgi:hypothetical protein